MNLGRRQHNTRVESHAQSSLAPSFYDLSRSSLDAKDVVRHGRTASGVRRAGLSLHGVLFRYGAGTALQASGRVCVADRGQRKWKQRGHQVCIRIALGVRKVSASVPDRRPGFEESMGET